jgi:hypothetical protein
MVGINELIATISSRYKTIHVGFENAKAFSLNIECFQFEIEKGASIYVSQFSAGNDKDLRPENLVKVDFRNERGIDTLYFCLSDRVGVEGIIELIELNNKFGV